MSHTHAKSYAPALAPPRHRAPVAAKPITLENVVINGFSVANAVILAHVSAGFTGAHAPGVSARSAYDDQAYFWTKEWQDGEAQVDADYETGNFYEPKDARDLIRWLREG